MSLELLNVGPPSRGVARAETQSSPAPPGDLVSPSQKIARLLWTEMLSHAGFEEALIQGSGQHASAFARYVVEAIASDLSETHPIGFERQTASLPPSDLRDARRPVE